MSNQPTFINTFKNCCKKGQSPWTCVQNIAKKQGKTETTIWNTLCKYNLAFCKTFNGKKIYFPTIFNKTTIKNSKITEFNFCIWGIEFCLQQGWCTPEQIYTWNMKQITWFIGQCINKHFTKPAGFNPNKKVNGFPNTWNIPGTTTGTTKTKTGTKTGTKTKTRKGTKTGTKTAKRKTTTGTKKTYKTGTKNYKFSYTRNRKRAA